MLILCLPLDSRACNIYFPKELAEFAGAECRMPPMTSMDFFKTPARWEDTESYLLEGFASADALAISIDHLLFGSLLASREDEVNLETAMERLALLETLHQMDPAKPIYAWSIIMRSSISMLSQEGLDVYEAMMEYSYNADKASITGGVKEQKLAEEARQKIPSAILQKYHAVRMRNHAVNCACVEMAKRGVLTELMLLMEDSQVYGFHRMEERELGKLLKDCRNIWLHNGANEGGCLCVMKAITGGKPFYAEVAFAGRNDGFFVAKYEDRMFNENLRDTFRFAGVQESKGAETVFAVAAPGNGIQGDFCAAQLPKEEDGICAAETVNQLLDAGRNVYLLDLLAANGGSLSLVQHIHHPERLCGYSAWETASNSLGTLVAQMCLDAVAGKPNRRFMKERMLDDLLYEGKIRASLNERLTEIGEDVYSLKDKERAEQMLRQCYKETMTEHLLPFDDLSGYQISLPWSRTFEVQVLDVSQADANLKRMA